ncbi:universal stress protein family [Colletotrichum karsti]|uniref:Universal stress protein family n=1 Tax=Colletotrichum karsti TaxID=1095194 RepID=A0A9P6I752_9PEZI|nr:universal stress protein family [Colletotrichum karsti]KAF9877474.1 universal stress protein family [Colletotrichum karsti]
MPEPSPHITLPVQSPDSDVSPKTALQPKDKGKSDYFSIESQKKEEEKKGADAGQLSRATTLSSLASPSLDSTKENSSADSSRTESFAARHRGSSISSLTFAPVRNPSLPQGNQKQTGKERIRASSPPPERFQTHVAFDNLPIGEATKNNTPSLTLNVKHKGYQAQRRSRTFMVGVDEHAYSDYALQWLLDELVDDGDEIVCVRVIEKEVRTNDKAAVKAYRDEAESVMNSILKRNGANRAISVVLEYASGKLHSTFQKLIQMYQPAMLIVGTRGRSLGGLQGLVNTRNSFSKYCLQYSPVPVVVVRPTEKREKKKNKRKNDSERQTYVRMLSATGGKHEADSERSSMYEVEVRNTADEEAHQVAKALGLPAAFDPTIKPVDLNSFLQPRGYSLSQTTSVASGKAPPSTAGDSDDDDDDDEDEFEVIPGDQLINTNQKEKLHKMEVGEAAALLQQNRKDSLDSSGNVDDEEDDESKESRTSSAS